LPATATSVPSQLLQVLLSESEAVQRFTELLLREQDALKSAQTDELPTFAENKTQLAQALNQLSAQRNSVLAASGFASDRAGIEAWCAKHASEKRVAEVWEAILTLAREARELNRLNGELIAIQLQYNAKALDALRGGDSALKLYGRDGQAQMISSRRINDAA